MNTHDGWNEPAASSHTGWMNGHAPDNQLLNERRLTRLEFGHDALRERIALIEADAEWVKSVAWGLFWRLARGLFFLSMGLLADQALGSGAILKGIRSHFGF